MRLISLINALIASHYCDGNQTTLTRRSASEDRYPTHYVSGPELNEPIAENFLIPDTLRSLKGACRTFLHDPLYCLEVRNAEILDHSPVVTDAENRVVIESLLQCPLQAGQAVRFFNPLSRLKKRILGMGSRRTTLPEAFLLASHFSANYYHFLFDLLIKIDVLFKAMKQGVCSPPVVLVPPGLRQFAHDYLAMLDLPEIVELPGRLRIGRLWVPSSCQHVAFHRPSSVRFLVQALREGARLPDAPSAPTRRLFVSRNDAASRRQPNEHVLFGLLRELGFETVTLAGMPVRDQMMLFQEAEIVCGEHGAGLANVVFMKRPRLVELFPRHQSGESVGGRFFYINLVDSLGGRYAALPSYEPARKGGHDCCADTFDAGLKASIRFTIDQLFESTGALLQN